MATKKASGKKPATGKPAKKRTSRRYKILNECAGFSIHTSGKKLTIQADEEVSLDFEFNVMGKNCRSAIQCKIVNGQWEC